MLSATLMGTYAVSARPDGPQYPKVLVDFRRSGGLVGVDDHLTISENGRATFTSKRGTQRNFALSPHKLRRLKAVLKKADFAKLCPNPQPCPMSQQPTPKPDAFQYWITYEGRTVRTQSGDLPAVLQPVIQVLTGIK